MFVYRHASVYIDMHVCIEVCMCVDSFLISFHNLSSFTTCLEKPELRKRKKK